MTANVRFLVIFTMGMILITECLLGMREGGPAGGEKSPGIVAALPVVTAVAVARSDEGVSPRSAEEMRAADAVASYDHAGARVSSSGSPAHGLSAAAHYAVEAGMEPGEPDFPTDMSNSLIELTGGDGPASSARVGDDSNRAVAECHRGPARPDGLDADDIKMEDALAALSIDADLTDPMGELYNAIDRATAKDLALVKKLVRWGIDDEYFARTDLSFTTRFINSPFWHALSLLATKRGTPDQYEIRRQMLLVLAGIFDGSKKRLTIGRNAGGLSPLHYVINVEKPNPELVRLLLANKICSPDCLDRLGNTAIINLANRPMMQSLLDLGVPPRFNFAEGTRPDRVVYFVIRFNGTRWVIDRDRTPEEIGRIQALSSEENCDGCCIIL